MSPELGPLSGVGAATARVPNEGKLFYIVAPEVRRASYSPAALGWLQGFGVQYFKGVIIP